jgi:hypothetical protein
MLLLFWRAAYDPITSTDLLQKPVNCVLAGEQSIKDRYREWDVPAAGRTERTAVSRSAVKSFGGKPSFTTKTGPRGYD